MASEMLSSMTGVNPPVESNQCVVNPATPPTASTSRASSPPPGGVTSSTVQPLPAGCLALPSDWSLNERELCDLELMLNGGFAPLTGYMTENQYHSVLNHMRLSKGGEVWPIPIVLAIPKSAGKANLHWVTSPVRRSVHAGDEAAEAKRMDEETTDASKQVIHLRDALGTVVGDLWVEDIYEPNIPLEMERVLGTQDPNHPYMEHFQRLQADDCVYVGGKVDKRADINHFDFQEIRKTPSEMKGMIKDMGWDVVIGFQTRNPMHCSHFELTRQAMREVEAEEAAKGRKNVSAKLLLTPAVGPTQPGDIEYHIRVRCYKKLLPYYPEDSVALCLIPLAMRMAGPREAVWHAIIRRNYGCTHFIVGRDHAGPSTRKEDGNSFYGPYEAHELLKSVQDKLGIKPVFGKSMMYVGEKGYVQLGSVPGGVEPQSISGTELRRRLQNRDPIPEWYSFPSVVEELHKFYLPKKQKGLCLYFTGLPCSGKSTLASAVEAALQENDLERRRISLVDADLIRTHLSKGLGFSKEDRSSNVRRIGFLASEVVKHNGICVVANIAPYKEDREFNRKLITQTGGGYVEIFVCTPIDVCESRDVKELYKKARKGVIQSFTGVSDPYQEPENAEIVVDSSSDIHGKVRGIVEYLRANAFVG